MIDAKELRIGNYVDHLGDIEIIDRLGSDFVGTNKATDATEDVEGIPLNEEWLLKFGFDKFDGPSFTQYQICHKINQFEGYEKHSFLVNRKGERIDWVHKGSGAELKHVHQLQNLYFALTGEELKIKHD